MQPLHLLLPLFLLVLLPGMWTDPQGKWEPWLTPTCSHPCIVGPHRGGQGGGHRQAIVPTTKGPPPHTPQLSEVLQPCPPAQSSLPHIILPSPAPLVLGFRHLSSQGAKGPSAKPGVLGCPQRHLLPAGSLWAAGVLSPSWHNSPALGSNPSSRSWVPPSACRIIFLVIEGSLDPLHSPPVKQHLKAPPAAKMSLHLHPQPLFPIPGLDIHRALARGHPLPQNRLHSAMLTTRASFSTVALNSVSCLLLGFGHKHYLEAPKLG